MPEMQYQHDFCNSITAKTTRKTKSKFMKTPKLTILFMSLVFQLSALAQIQRYDNQDSKNDNVVYTGEAIINNQQSQICLSAVNNQLIITNNYIDKFDRLIVYNMQGAVVLKQPVSGNSARIDVSSLIETVYLLVLRSSSTLKEKSLKLVISR